MAFNLFKHALRMLWANLGNAARVSVVPFLILLAVGAVIFAFAYATIGDDFFPGFGSTDYSSGAAPVLSPGQGAFLFLAVFGGILIASVLFCWVAVNWHRFVLLEEYPTGWVPPWRGAEIKLYFWRGLALFGAMMLIYLVVGFLLAAMAAAVPVVAIIVGVVLIVLLSWVFYRWSIILPAAAIGTSKGLSEAWEQTKPHSGMIFAYFLIFVGFSILIGILQAGVEYIPLIGWAFSIVISWFNTMLGLSLITTLYGVVVEGRTIED